MKNIWAVGRNYSAHAKELGNEVPSEPFIFLKSGSCLVKNHKVQLPSWAVDVHYEGELAVEFTKSVGGEKHPQPNQEWGFARVYLALDLTERKKQAELKSKGLPWTLAKSFQNACPISSQSVLLENEDTFKNLSFTLKLNGELKQQGSPKQMIFGLSNLKDFVLKHFPVEPGDLLLTGTPEGVGPVKPLDKIEMQLFSNPLSSVPILSQEWSFHS